MTEVASWGRNNCLQQHMLSSYHGVVLGADMRVMTIVYDILRDDAFSLLKVPTYKWFNTKDPYTCPSVKIADANSDIFWQLLSICKLSLHVSYSSCTKHAVYICYVQYLWLMSWWLAIIQMLMEKSRKPVIQYLINILCIILCKNLALYRYQIQQNLAME